jgi:hypothetical protein
VSRARRAPAARVVLAALAALVAAALSAVARPARAEVTIPDYQLTLRARSESTVEVEMRLTYRAVFEVKTDGFKFVGRDEPTDLSARAPDGSPLEVRSELEASSRQYRITFALPPPDAGGLQTVTVRFAQHRSPDYGWGTRVYELEWAGTFRVQVDRMRVVAQVPAAASPEGFTCGPAQNGWHTCVRVTDAPASVRVPLAPDAGGIPVAMVWPALGFVGLLFLSTLLLRRHRLLRERGVLPPAQGLGYEATSPIAYRAPPELPTPAEVQAILGQSDARSFRTRAIVSTIALAASFAMLGLFVRGPAFLPPPVLILIAAALATALAVAFNFGKKALVGLLVPVVVIGLASMADLGGWLAFTVLSGLVGGIVAVVQQNVTYVRAGGASSASSGCSSSSSSSSSSSCGGGGGSSCGGGGGSSCGGGGGGGGCGG